MKYFVKTCMFVLATIILVMLISTSSTAQCVECQLNQSTWCWECVGIEESGAIKCPEVSCYNCRVSGVCIIQGLSSRQSLLQNDTTAQKVVRMACDSKSLEAIARDDAALRIAPLKFDPNTIREIAAMHPRFAATLASYNRTGGLTHEVGRQVWTPIELKAEDVEWWFKSSEDAAPFFSSLCQKAQPINKLIRSGEISPIIYDISVTKSADSARSIIALQAVGSSAIDPPYSFLEIVVSSGAAGDTSSTERSTVSWRIR